MRIRFTLFLLALNFATFGLILFLERGGGREDTADPGLPGLLGREIVEATRIELRWSGQDTPRILERSGSTWRIVEPVQWAANFYAINRILNQLQFLESRAAFTTAEIERSGQTLADFGLEQPKLTMVIANDRESITLRIGVNTEVGNNVYLLGPDGKQVYVIDEAVVGELSVELDDLRMTEVFNIPVFEVDSLSLLVAGRETNGNGERRIRLARVNDGWAFEAPISAEADPDLVNTAINKLASVKAKRFIEPQAVDPVLQGLESPSMEVTLQGNRRRATLLLGKPDPSETTPHYYAQLEGNPTVFTVPGKPFDDLREAEDALRERNFMIFDRDNTSLLEISYEDDGGRLSQVRLQRLEASDAWQVLGSADGGEVRSHRADPQVVAGFIDELARLHAESFVIDSPEPADLARLGFDEPVRSVRVEDGGESAFELTLAHPPDDNERLFARTNRAPYIYGVDRAGTLATLPLRVLHFRDRTLETMPPAALITGLTLENLETGELLFDARVDPASETWGTRLEERPEAFADAVFFLLEQLRSFRVDSFLYTGFTDEARLDRRTTRPWVFRLSASVLLPGGESPTEKTREYVLSGRLGGTLQLGGSPEQDVVFTLTQEMIDAIDAIAGAVEPPPEALDQPVPEPAPVPALDATAATAPDATAAAAPDTTAAAAEPGVLRP